MSNRWSSEEIETVRKENVFSEEVTEADMDIIQKRVALQQRQFAEFERRDKARKYKKIKGMFDYLTTEEIDEMLVDCENDEVKGNIISNSIDSSWPLKRGTARTKSSFVWHSLDTCLASERLLPPSMLQKSKQDVS